MKLDIHERAGRYISSIYSTAGANGSTQALLAAQHLVRGFGIPIPEAKPIFAAWNETNAEPRWSEKDLDRKLAEALEKGQMPMGCHLKDDKAREWRNSGPNKHPAGVPVTKCASDAQAIEKAARKAAERAAVMASLRRPDEPERKRIAALRDVSAKAVLYLSQDGLLEVGLWRNHPVFAFRSGDFAQIRRIDGKRFWEEGPKELNMAEPTPAFVFAANNSPPGTRMMIAEGFVELLALMELEIRADDYRRENFPDSLYQPVAFAVASSAGSKLAGSDLAKMSGRRVRIIPDNDPSGHKATHHWTEALQSTGCPVDNRLMPVGKDLGEALRSIPDHACYHLLQF